MGDFEGDFLLDLFYQRELGHERRISTDEVLEYVADQVSQVERKLVEGGCNLDLLGVSDEEDEL